ncbi:hypothetical protein JTB14_016495 [Gonioctena quinquepunctata]|nr:hypothetical protein JTB14_016495 [Gonioctena quinquepunctata]
MMRPIVAPVVEILLKNGRLPDPAVEIRLKCRQLLDLALQIWKFLDPMAEIWLKKRQLMNIDLAVAGSSSVNQSSFAVSPKEVFPLSKQTSRENKTSREKLVIITSSPYKNELWQKYKEK